MDIICVGEMVIDFLPGEKEGTYIRKAGGAPANTAISISRCGCQSGFCGRVGNDDFGMFLQKTLINNSVQILCPELVDDAITTMAFVTLDNNGERSFTFARKPGADMFLTRENIDKSKILNATIIHAGSCSLSKNPAADATIYAINQAKANKKIVSFDVNYRGLLWNENRQDAICAVEKILPMVNFLKISDEETDMLSTNGDIKLAMDRYGIDVIVQTLGSNGAECYWNGNVLKINGRKATCVDATGAGDAFWGGFLSSLIQSGIKDTCQLTEKCLYRALEYGNIAGWLCVQKKGAIESLPTATEIEEILNKVSN